MGKVIVQNGDLLDFSGDIIIQQCNCLTRKAAGLAEAINTKYPYANIYGLRRGVGNLASPEDRAIPGTIQVLSGNGPAVACLFAQWKPGKCGSRYYSECTQYIDTLSNREKWFSECLDHLKEYIGKRLILSIAFPAGIGCGLAGGTWRNYEAMIYQFAGLLSEKCTVYIISQK